MREVHDAQHAEDQAQPERDATLDAADQQAVDQREGEDQRSMRPDAVSQLASRVKMALLKQESGCVVDADVGGMQVAPLPRRFAATLSRRGEEAQRCDRDAKAGTGQTGFTSLPRLSARPHRAAVAVDVLRDGAVGVVFWPCSSNLMRW